MKLAYSEVLDSAWKSLKDDLALVAGLTFVWLVGAGLVNAIPMLGNVLSFPLLAGYVRCLLKIRAKENFGYEDFFWGFLNFNRLLHLVLANLLIGLGMVVGLILLLVPGIWWIIASFFTLQNMVLKDVDSVGAIQTSMQQVKGRWWNIFGFALVIGLLNIAGALCFFVGLLVSIPVSALAVVIATEQITLQMAPSGPQISGTPQGSAAPVETTTTAPQ